MRIPTLSFLPFNPPSNERVPHRRCALDTVVGHCGYAGVSHVGCCVRSFPLVWFCLRHANTWMLPKMVLLTYAMVHWGLRCFNFSIAGGSCGTLAACARVLCVCGIGRVQVLLSLPFPSPPMYCSMLTTIVFGLCLRDQMFFGRSLEPCDASDGCRAMYVGGHAHAHAWKRARAHACTPPHASAHAHVCAQDRDG